MKELQSCTRQKDKDYVHVCFQAVEALILSTYPHSRTKMLDKATKHILNVGLWVLCVLYKQLQLYYRQLSFFLSILHVKKNETGGDGETGKESVSAVQSH